MTIGLPSTDEHIVTHFLRNANLPVLEQLQGIGMLSPICLNKLILLHSIANED